MHSGHRKRLKERFTAEGLDNFQPHEVLELLLTYAIPVKDVNPLAHELMHEFGSLAAVLEADEADLKRVAGIKENAASLLCLMPQLSRYYSLDRWGEKPVLTNHKAAGDYLLSLFTGRSNEVFYLVCLDSQLHILYPALIMEGTVDETPMYPRLAVAAALRHHAQSVIIAHNHPGGSKKPSYGDIECTRRLVSALNAVDIAVHDHIIIAQGEAISLQKAGNMHAREVPYDLGLVGWKE